MSGRATSLEANDLLEHAEFLRRLDTLRAKAEQLEGSGGVRVGKIPVEELVTDRDDLDAHASKLPAAELGGAHDRAEQRG